MTSIPFNPSTPTAQRGPYIDDATDSGYGGSVKGGSSPDRENLFEQSFSTEMHHRNQLPTTRQQEIYQENCRLLTGSIDDTKHILKVPFGRMPGLTFS